MKTFLAIFPNGDITVSVAENWQLYYVQLTGFLTERELAAAQICEVTPGEHIWVEGKTNQPMTMRLHRKLKRFKFVDGELIRS